jgi:hypothetical protein
MPDNHSDVFNMVKDVQVVFGKGPSSQPIPNDANRHAPMWKKMSIFWELPYRQVLEVHSGIHAMHLMKNLCVKLIGFMGVYKDTQEARQDM